MQTRRSTVLGKRGHQEASTPAPSSPACEQLQTPDNTPTPKRARTSVEVLGDDSNKENVPPFNCSPVNAPTTPRATRALRRAATEATITPPRTPPAPRRTASVVSLSASTPPSTEISHLAISTPPPTPPANLLPLHARVRALLRSTCNSAQTQIAGRDGERSSIMDFLASFAKGSCENNISESSSTLFISGAPGTGKTALVNSIIREVSAETEIGLNVISINCMSLKDVDALWERMIEELSSNSTRKSKKPKGRDGLTSILESLKFKCVVVLDELDHITPNTQALTSIFTLTEKLSPHLRLIAIANTHTLTSSSATSALIPSNNVRTIHFAPHSPLQLQSILQSRLNSLSDSDCSAEFSAAVKKLLPIPTLTLLTKKIAALTGDVRSLFEVLRGAIDLSVAAAAASTSSDSEENPLNPPSLTVSPQNVLAALKAYTPASVTPKTSLPSSGAPATSSNSETVTKIRNLGLQARLVLLAMLLASKRLESGLSLLQFSSTSPKKPSASTMKRSSSLPTSLATQSPGVETGSLHAYYTAVLSRTESGIFEPVSRSEFGDLLGVLEGVGVASLSSSLGAAASMSSPTKGRKAFSRSSSFGAGLGKNGAGAVGEVRLAEGMWGDEVLRGLGVSGVLDASISDPREEEVRAIWGREQTRLARDVKAAISATNSQIDAFADAFQD